MPQSLLLYAITHIFWPPQAEAFQIYEKAKQTKIPFTQEDDLHEINFAIGQVAQNTHQIKQTY